MDPNLHVVVERNGIEIGEWNQFKIDEMKQ